MVMKRDKFGSIYYTLIGGGVNMQEDLEQALRRELKEETGLAVNNPKLVFVEEAGPPYGTQYVFLCDYISGEPELQPDAEEAAINKLGQNLYQPMWVKFEELDSLTFRSEQLKAAIKKAESEGYPDSPQIIVG